MDYSLFLVVTYNPSYVDSHKDEFKPKLGKFNELLEESEQAALESELVQYQKDSLVDRKKNRI